MVFDASGHPNGPQNGSSRDTRPSARRAAANGRGVIDMPKPVTFTSQGEYVSVAAPIPTQAPRSLSGLTQHWREGKRSR